MKNRSLKNIAKSIIHSSKENEGEHVLLLYDFYQNFLKENEQADLLLSSGIALSTKNAADCIRDYKRTASFIKGVYKALLSALKTFPDTRLNILYAGCGPFAPLILPLLPLFKPEQLSVTLIDINECSIETIKEIVAELEYEPYIANITVADATQYKYSKLKNLHLVITETMFQALTREPQVAITRNLAPQLTKGGILIPEEIKLSWGFSFFSKEPYLHQYKNEYEVKNNVGQTLKKTPINTLFTLNKGENSEQQSPYYYESKWHEKPEDYKEAPDICIYTTISIFDTHTLENQESLITNPYCLFSLYNLKKHDKFRMRYDTQTVPQWEILVN